MIRSWLRRQLIDILGIQEAHSNGQATTVGLGTVHRTPEEAAALNYNLSKPLKRVKTSNGSWKCPAGHKNPVTSTGYVNCPKCCWPMHVDTL